MTVKEGYGGVEGTHKGGGLGKAMEKRRQSKYVYENVIMKHPLHPTNTH